MTLVSGETEPTGQRFYVYIIYTYTYVYMLYIHNIVMCKYDYILYKIYTYNYMQMCIYFI